MINVLKGYEQAPASWQLLSKLFPLTTLTGPQAQALLSFLQQQEKLSAKLSGTLPFLFDDDDDILGENFGEVLRHPRGLEYMKRGLALVALSNLLAVDLSLYGLTPEDYAEKSLAAAIWTELLAEMVEEDPMEAFMVGLYYRLGMLPIARIVHRIKPDARLPQGTSLTDQAQWERNHVGRDFGVIGYDMLQQWGFPAAITNPIRGQLRPALCGQFKASALRLQIAQVLAKTFYSTAFTAPLAEVPTAAMAQLGLNLPEITSNLQIAMDRFHRLRERTIELSVRRPQSAMTRPPF